MERKIYVGRDRNGKLALYSDIPQWLPRYREFAQNAESHRSQGLFVELLPNALSEEQCPRGEFVEVNLVVTKA